MASCSEHPQIASHGQPPPAPAGVGSSTSGASSSASPAIDHISSMPDDILVKIFSRVAADRAADLLGATRASRRFRALSRQPELWESPVFHKNDQPEAFLSICASVGAHFRRVSLSAMHKISARNAIRGLSRCPNITHLSL
eukprot:tig00000826_g4572.t1